MTDSNSGAVAADPVTLFFGVLFSFRGRIGRARYWIGLAVTVAIAFGLLAITAEANNPTGGTQLMVLMFPLLILFIWVHLAVLIKRLRDAGFGTGAIILYALAPIAWLAATAEFFEYIWGPILLVLLALWLLPGLLKSAPAVASTN